MVIAWTGQARTQSPQLTHLFRKTVAFITWAEVIIKKLMVKINPNVMIVFFMV
jgi:hypothetical protein